MPTDKTINAGAPEIEITPAMVNAGALVLAAYDTTFAEADWWAKRVYRAMRQAAFSDAAEADSV